MAFLDNNKTLRQHINLGCYLNLWGRVSLCGPVLKFTMYSKKALKRSTCFCPLSTDMNGMWHYPDKAKESMFISFPFLAVEEEKVARRKRYLLKKLWEGRKQTLREVLSWLITRIEIEDVEQE